VDTLKTRHRMPGRIASRALAAGAVMTLTSCGAGPDAAAPPDFDGDVSIAKQATVTDSGGVSVGIARIGEDGARLEVADGVTVERVDVAVGEMASALGLSVRLCATWLDPDPGSQPGGDESRVYLVFGAAGEEPECPARTDDAS
jgi:hypothetical protein